MDYFPLI